MTSIAQLATAGAGAATDLLPISQGGGDNAYAIRPGALAIAQTVFASPVPRTLEGRLADVFSIEDAGVTHDPAGARIAANTAAYLDALTKTSGIARLRHRAGLSVVASPIILSAPIHLEIDGLLQLAPAVNAGLLMLGGSGNVITGSGTFDGNKANQTGTGTGGYGIANASGGITDAIIGGGLTIQNCYNWPLNITQSSNVRVNQITLLNSGNSPQFANGCSNSHIENGYISGIADEGFAFYGGAVNCSARNLRITLCNSGVNIFSDTFQTAPCSGVEVIGCTSWNNTLSGFVVSTNGISAIHDKIKFLGNISTGNNSGASASGSEFYLNAVKNFSLVGNTASDTVGASSAGVELTATAQYGTIADSTISNIGTSGTNNVGVNFGGGLGVVYNGG